MVLSADERPNFEDFRSLLDLGKHGVFRCPSEADSINVFPAKGNCDRILHGPQALVGFDGNCVAPYGIVSQGMPHSRFYGTFPRILNHYVREEHLPPLETAIHKMTGATARALKLQDRGLLKEGFCADIAIFDPNDFVDRATYAKPHQFPTAARTTVIVDGITVVENANHTRALPGRVPRRDSSGVVR